MRSHDDKASSFCAVGKVTCLLDNAARNLHGETLLYQSVRMRPVQSGLGYLVDS